jgi:Arc/MetJ family transcription regulator
MRLFCIRSAQSDSNYPIYCSGHMETYNFMRFLSSFLKIDLHITLLMCIYFNDYTHGRKIMRTNIVIDDKLMAEAIELSRLKTKKAVVESGLRLLIRIKKQERIKSLRGKLKWDGDLEKMRLDQ